MAKFKIFSWYWCVFWCFVILKLWSDQEGSKSSHAQHPRAHWLIHSCLRQSKSIWISREKKMLKIVRNRIIRNLSASRTGKLGNKEKHGCKWVIIITNLVSHETTHFGNQTVSVEEKQGKVNEGKVHSEFMTLKFLWRNNSTVQSRSIGLYGP